tara:strand:+ start:454 stop:1536 length:1083 start_codon:yes stop_codon:yes gene_type:complete
MFGQSIPLGFTGGGFAPSDNFNTVLYDGDGQSPRSITGVGFEPDFTWIRERDQYAWHVLTDSVRGTTNADSLFFNNQNTAANSTAYRQYGHLSSFDSDGFTVTSGSSDWVNENNTTLVSWNWKGGGAAVTNNDGTVTSQVSANVAAGFSVVEYTGGGVAGTVGHGLDSAPELIFLKRYTEGANYSSMRWLNYTESAPSNVRPYGHSPDEFYAPWFTSVKDNGVVTTPSATVLNYSVTSNSYQQYDNVLQNNVDFKAYCWHSVENYQKISSYVGAGYGGTSVNVGFRPAFVMIRKTTAAGKWYMFDNKRLNGPYSYAIDNTSGLELSAFVELTSTGFDVSDAYPDSLTDLNITYVYMAIAE